jgi:hypothetical protein
MKDKGASRKPVKDNGTLVHPRIAELIRYYVDHHLARLGPYPSSVFFVLITNSILDEERPASYVKSAKLSIAQLADMAGMSKRKSIDALKALMNDWIIIRRPGRGRGNTNRYYFLPCAQWSHSSPVHFKDVKAGKVRDVKEPVG